MIEVPLGELMLRRAGTVLPSQHPGEEFDLYSIPAHDSGGFETISGDGIGSAKQVVNPSDVMVSKIVPHIRRARVVGPSHGRRQIASGEWIVFRSNQFVPEYLRHFLVSDVFHRQFMATVAGVGGSLLRARPNQVGLINVPLPSIDEQRRVAAILDQADELQAKRRRTLTLLDDLTQSTFVEMFGSLASSGKFVSDVCAPTKGSIRTGPFGSQLLHGEFVSQGIAVLGIDNVVTNDFRWVERRFITPEKYESLSRYTVFPGDVLITIMGTCGRCAVVPEETPLAINTKHLCAITVDQSQVLPEYLRACFLWHPECRRYLLGEAKGAIMDGLNMGIIKAMPVPLPSMDLQLLFLARVGYLTEHRQEMEVSALRIGELVASCQVGAFAGAL